MTDTQHNVYRKPGWNLRGTDQSTIAVITLVAVAAIAGSWLYRGGLRGQMVDIDAAAPIQVTYQLDINSADWPEWTPLPALGETMAKRIVQDRKERGPFRHQADLLRVRGVGPRTFDGMRPYLLPLSEAVTSPEQDAVADE